MDQIDFENDGLSGNLIPEVTNLDQLRFFILEQGEIGGTIPSQFGEFDRLLIFDLDFNELSGNIPDELFDMNVLQQLDLNDNNLEGTLSTNIGSMTTLTFLQLDHNNLEGIIPSEVGLLNSLRECNLVFVFCCLILIGTNIYHFFSFLSPNYIQVFYSLMIMTSQALCLLKFVPIETILAHQASLVHS